MRNFENSVILGITAIAVSIACSPAIAQPGPGWGPGMMMGPGMMRGDGLGYMCSPRAAGMAEWRIQRIEETVRPTDAQRSALNELKTASIKAAETITVACAATVPTTSVERMAQMEKRTDAMLQAIKIVRPAFDAFYGSLDSEQKARLDAGGPRRWGWQNWRSR